MMMTAGSRTKLEKLDFVKYSCGVRRKEILQPHRKAYDKQFRYTNTGQGRSGGAIREAKLRTYLEAAAFKLINDVGVRM